MTPNPPLLPSQPMKARKTSMAHRYMQVFMPTQSYIMGKYVPPSREEIVGCIVKYANDCRDLKRKIHHGTVSRMIWPEIDTDETA